MLDASTNNENKTENENENENKFVIKIKDSVANQEPSFFENGQYINFIRNVTPESGGDIIVNEGDAVIYTDLFVENIDVKSKYNIALLVESQAVNRWCYDYIANNNKKFDIVLTFDRTLLDRGENFIFNVFGTCWLHDSYIKIWDKSKLCSTVTSSKVFTSGHFFRREVTEYIKNNKSEIDIYGSNYLHLPYVTTRPFDKDHGWRHISNGKINALRDYMFSITIENNKEDYYFSEKLIDCFLTGTIPIYYGCPSISNFFNIKGIIVFDTLIDLINILPTINTELYESMVPYIQENYNIAQNYKTFKINEHALIDLMNN